MSSRPVSACGAREAGGDVLGQVEHVQRNPRAALQVQGGAVWLFAVAKGAAEASAMPSAYIGSVLEASGASAAGSPLATRSYGVPLDLLGLDGGEHVQPGRAAGGPHGGQQADQR
ncbi:hypothetical protein ACKI1O_07590 [Streptomyces scabiei]